MRRFHRSALVFVFLATAACAVEQGEPIGKKSAAAETLPLDINAFLLPENMVPGVSAYSFAGAYANDFAPHNDVTLTVTYKGAFSTANFQSFAYEPGWECTQTEAPGALTVRCHIPSLSQKAGYQLDITPTAAGTITAHAELSEGGVVVTTRDAIANVSADPTADLSLWANANPLTPAGTPAQFSFSVLNWGPGVAADTRLNVSLAGPGKIVGASLWGMPLLCTLTDTTASCDLGAVEPYSKPTDVVLDVVGTDVGFVSAQGTVSSSTTDLAPYNNWASTGTKFYRAAKTDIAVTTTAAPDPAMFNKPLTYTIVVTNNGPDASSGVFVEDFLPSIVSFKSVSTTQGFCFGNPFVMCDLGALSSGASATVKIVTTATEGGIAVNQTFAYPTPWNNELDPDYGNNFATTSTSIKGPSLPVITNSTQLREDAHFGSYVPCLGDFVMFNEGKLHTTFHSTYNKASNWSLFESATNPQGVKGVAVSSGNTYTATGVTRNQQKFSGYFPSSFDYHNNFRLIGKAKGPDLLIHEVVHVTFDAYGVPTVRVDKRSIECR